jgi:peptide/nickel transport system ATP-binding protein
VLVMYLGRIAEIGPVDDIFTNAAHPYTAALLDSRPSMDPDNRRTEPPLFGDPPNPVNPPSGCRFRTRCKFAEAVCAGTVPPLSGAMLGGNGHAAACLMVVPGSGHSAAPAA